MKSTMKGLVIRAEWAPKPGHRLSETEKKRKIAYRSDLVWKNPTWSVETDYPTPKITKPNQVLIKVNACGICGSDVHMLMKNPDDYMFFAGEAGFPVIIGHEFAGEIVEVGKEVNNFKVGDLVTVEECQYCSNCEACRLGYYNQCANLDQLGFDYPNNGAMAEYIVAEQEYCFSLNSLKRRYDNKEKILEVGALVEPTSVAYEGIFTVSGGMQSGGHVAVFGTGPIGLAAIQLLKTTGAAAVIVFEPNEFRRDLAKKMGADFAYDPTDKSIEPAEIVNEITNGSGVKMAVEASGEFLKTVPEMEKMLGVAGKIVLIGMSSDSPKIVPLAYQRKAGGFFGSLGHSGHGDFQSVINLMAWGRINMLDAVTSRYPLDKAVEAIYAAGKGKDAKVLIKP